MSSEPPIPAGWRDDPEGRRRWWDGAAWGAIAPWDASQSARTQTRPSTGLHTGPRVDRRYLADPTKRVSERRGAYDVVLPSSASWSGPSAPPQPVATPAVATAAPPPVTRRSLRPARPKRAVRLPRLRLDLGRTYPRWRTGPRRSLGFAYFLLLTLGPLGAHRFYLGRPGSACGLLWLTGMAVGLPIALERWPILERLGLGHLEIEPWLPSAALLLVIVLNLIVDLVVLPRLTRETNWFTSTRTC